MSSVAAILRPWLRVVLWTVVALTLLEGAWLGLFSWVEGSGRLRDWANRRPEKVRLDFESVSSLWPGLIEIHGLAVRGRTERGLDWQVEADRARLQIALLPLAGRRLVVRGAEIHGVDVSSLSPAEGEAESEARASARRDLRPLPEASAAAGATPEPVERAEVARAPRRRPRWTFEFRGLRADAVRSIVVDEAEIVGRVRGELGFAVRGSRGEGEIFPSSIEFDDVRLRHRGVETGRGLSGSIELEIAPYRYREERGRALLPHTSGRLRLAGELDDRALLEELLRRAPWITVEPGVAPVRADLRLRSGSLLVGSHLEIPRTGRSVRALDFAIEGPNALSLVVDREGGAARARWQVGFERFTLRREGMEAVLLEGEALAVAGVATPPDLARLAENSALRLELGRARLPDLSFVAAWLPVGTRIERITGSGEVAGALTADVADMRPGGAVKARVDDVRMSWGDLDLAGRLELELAISGGDLAARRLELAGTRLLLADFAAPGLATESSAAPTKWWMHLLVDEGEVRLGPPLEITSRFQTRLRDTAPLVALFETRRNLPGWAERLLTEEDVRVTGSVRASPGAFELDRLETELLGGNLSMRLRFVGADRRGKLLLAWRRLAIGAGLDGDRRELRITDAREWFSQRR